MHLSNSLSAPARAGKESLGSRVRGKARALAGGIYEKQFVKIHGS